MPSEKIKKLLLILTFHDNKVYTFIVSLGGWHNTGVDCVTKASEEYATSIFIATLNISTEDTVRCYSSLERDTRRRIV